MIAILTTEIKGERQRARAILTTEIEGERQRVRARVRQHWEWRGTDTPNYVQPYVQIGKDFARGGIIGSLHHFCFNMNNK